MGRRRLSLGARTAPLLASALLTGPVLVGCGAVNSPPRREPAIRSARAETLDEDPGAPRVVRAGRVRVRVIFVSLEGRTREQAAARARMISRTARADDFSQLAAEYGDGENVSNFGSSGLVLALEAVDDRLPPQVRDRAFELDVHEVSEPVEDARGFYILQRRE